MQIPPATYLHTLAIVDLFTSLSLATRVSLIDNTRVKGRVLVWA